MKIIVAHIRPKKWTAVQEALSQIAVERMTVGDVLGYAEDPLLDILSGSGELKQYVQIIIVVNDDFLDRTVEMIQKVARTGASGAKGDGKIFVIHTDEVIRIKTGLRGKGAV